MNIDPIAVLAIGGGITVAAIYYLLVGGKKSRDIGMVRCQRCDHIGYTKTKRGGRQVCEKCDSDNWVTV